jgi:hypothetical protein
MRSTIAILLILAVSACEYRTPEAQNVIDAGDNAMAEIEATADNLEAAADAAMGEQTSSPNSGWQYSRSKDEMRGATGNVATIEAIEPIRLPFPYGESTPMLTLRKDPKYGFDIFVRANGQFLCRSYNNDTVSVKFDGGPIREWSCAEAESGSSEIVFINRESAFLAELKKAKKVTIEANMYEAGRQQMTFNVAGLVWQ